MDEEERRIAILHETPITAALFYCKSASECNINHSAAASIEPAEHIGAPDAV